jgi:ribosome-associated protein
MKMKKVSGVSDYFVIASGSSTTQTRAIADHVVQVMRAKGERVRHVEGLREASWVLVDCTDVVAHIFLKDTRRFYDLESLWNKAPKERLAEPKTRKARAPGPLKKKKINKKTKKKATKPKPKRSRKS